MSLNSSIKILLINKFHPSLKGPRKGASLFPKTGLVWKHANFQSLDISFGSTVKELSVLVPLLEVPIERCLFPEPFFIHL
jgi:hypothetical protein